MIMQQKEKYNPERASWIKNYFTGRDVYIVGGGPSLFGFDFTRLDGRRVIAINHSYRYCKPEILVFLDGKFKKEVSDIGHDLYSMPFKIIAGPSSGMKNQGNCTIVQMSQRPSVNPASLYGRAQSGLVAINLSIIANAKRIFLLGFDAKFRDGMGHFYSKEWRHTMDGKEEQYKKMSRCYDAFRNYKNIFNCCVDSGIAAFQKISIDQALEEK